LQKAGRIARNGQFGQVYEIYNSEDLNTPHIQADNKESASMLHRAGIFAYEIAQEEQTLNAIEQRKPR